jgi:hypothetical protein
LVSKFFSTGDVDDVTDAAVDASFAEREAQATNPIVLIKHN